MKKFILSFLIIIIVTQTARTQKFEFNPININFRTIENKGDTIAALGDFGSMLLSFDNAENWKQIRVFAQGKMIKLFLDDTEMLAFNDVGQISISYDKGNTWEMKADLNDSVYAVVRFPEGYFLRSDSNLKILSYDFKIIKEFTLYSPPLGNYYRNEYRKSLVYFKNYLISEIDNAKFLRFDSHLSLIDTIDFVKLTSSTSVQENYQIDIDSNYLYTKIGYIIYKSRDFITAEIAYDSVDSYKLINDKMYFVYFPGIYYPDSENFEYYLYQVFNKDSAIKIIRLEDTYVTSDIRPKDFTIVNGKLIIVGDKKLLFTVNLSDSILNVISDFSGGNYYTFPDKINDSTYLFYNGFYYGLYHNYIYITKNNGITIKPLIDTKVNPDYKKYYYYLLKYFNLKDSVLSFIGSDWPYFDVKVITFYNFGKNINYSEIPEYNFDISIPNSYIPKISFFPNIQKLNDNFITTSNVKYIKAYNKILTYNKNYDLVSKYQDSNYVINYVYSKDTNTFLIHCINLLDTTREIRYTSDKGLNWELIKKYPDEDSILYYKEINIYNKPALAMLNYNYIDSNIKIEILDFETRIISKIYSYKETRNNYEILINNGIFNSNDTIFIAIKDTLFYTKDIYDKSKWKYINFPNNGKIIRTCTKFGDTFFARYSDDIHPDNIYWLKISELEKPKPLIEASDYDFGKQDIKSKDTLSAILRINNISSEADLIITGYSFLNDSAFTSDLPQIDSINFLKIKPGEFLEYKIIFKPTEVKKYEDSIMFYSNAVGNDNIAYLRGEGIDTTTAVYDVSIEVQNYLYAYPPFPIPAKNYVRTLIYWDTSLDIDKDEIAIYNIYGIKIEGRENIRIDKKASYNGWLVWDCSGIDSGIYFMKINHGTKTLYLKTMIDR